MKPERSIGVCADLIIEIEKGVELLVLKDGGQKILQKATSASPSFFLSPLPSVLLRSSNGCRQDCPAPTQPRQIASSSTSCTLFNYSVLCQLRYCMLKYSVLC